MRIAHLSDPHLMRGPLAAQPAANLARALGRALAIQLRLHDAEPSGFVAEPTGFLLHVLDGSRCVTHSVVSSHAAAVTAF